MVGMGKNESKDGVKDGSKDYVEYDGQDDKDGRC